MNERDDVKDFRATRHRLPPDAFALGPEEPDPAPEDLVEERIWTSIISFPDHVSLRTTDEHGSEVKAMQELWASWIESVGEERDPMSYVMLDAGDEFQGCLLNSLCGFYRAAASCLRTALELTLAGTYFQLQSGSGSRAEVLKWKEGKRGLSFEDCHKYLRGHPAVEPLEDHLCGQHYDANLPYSVFGQRRPHKASSWTRGLYRRLGDFTHSRGRHSSGMMWEGSNGPIYVPDSFREVYLLYLETMALGYLLVKLARPTFGLPQAARYMFPRPPALPSKVALYSYEFLWQKPS